MFLLIVSIIVLSICSFSLIGCTKKRQTTQSAPRWPDRRNYPSAGQLIRPKKRGKLAKKPIAQIVDDDEDDESDDAPAQPGKSPFPKQPIMSKGGKRAMKRKKLRAGNSDEDDEASSRPEKRKLKGRRKFTPVGHESAEDYFAPPKHQ